MASLKPGTRGSFADPNAGSGKAVSLPDASIAVVGSDGKPVLGYGLTTTLSGEIRRRQLGGEVQSVASRPYDGTTDTFVTLTPNAPGLVGGESIRRTIVGRFDTKDVGTGKTVAVTVTLSDGSIGSRASNYDPPVGLTGKADITPATLQYVANPVTGASGAPIPPLTGTVSGFVAGETQAVAASGSLTFTTPATPASPAGSYPVAGGGLSATNYRFEQAPGNAQALTLTRPVSGRSDADDASRVATLSAISSVTPPASTTSPAEGRVLDAIPAVGGSGASAGSFASIPVAAMSQAQLLALLSARERYMGQVFEDSIRRLEQDPALSNAPACVSVDELATGNCILSADLKRRIVGEPAAGTIATAPRAPIAPADATAATAATAAAADAASASAAPAAAAAAAPPASPAPPLPSAAATAATAGTAAGSAASPPPVATLDRTTARATASRQQRRVITAALPQIERKIALVIGVDQYADKSIPSWTTP